VTDARLRARLARALVPTDLPGRPGLRHLAATPQSRLSKLAGEGAPYWAYLWPGGAALIAHLAACPDVVAGRRVLDLGTGSGLVGIAALRSGAGAVVASDSDPVARAVAGMNAALNGVTMEVVGDLLDGPVPAVDLVLVGDLFYDPALAGRVLPFLRRAAGQGAAVLVGDIGRAPLPGAALQALADYPVRDLAQPPGQPPLRGVVYRLAG
jgi:predicted nicotinamide N-methyase